MSRVDLNKTALSYDDVLLVPKFSDIRSRKDIDIGSDLESGINLKLPIISSPMDTISESDMATSMSQAGGMAVIHRYNSIEGQVDIIKRAYELTGESLIVGAAIGVSGDYIERAQALIESGVHMLCLDVAHGHHVLMKEALSEIRKITDRHGTHIMAGNVATLEGVNDLSDWGAHSVRCNIGGGSICSTRIQTGHGLPGLDTIFRCAATDRDVKIIADGGIKNSGDMVKALAAGADAVMVGSLLSGTHETPGQSHKDSTGRMWKTYRGMASKEAQVNWRGKYSSFEGVTTRVPHKGRVLDVLLDLEKGIRSGLSYSGANSVSQLQAKAEFVVQTNAGQSESGTHINNRQWS